MVWLYYAPIPVWSSEGGNLLVKMISTCRHGLSGGAGQHPVVRSINCGRGKGGGGAEIFFLPGWGVGGGGYKLSCQEYLSSH